MRVCVRVRVCVRERERVCVCACVGLCVRSTFIASLQNRVDFPHQSDLCIVYLCMMRWLLFTVALITTHDISCKFVNLSKQADL